MMLKDILHIKGCLQVLRNAAASSGTQAHKFEANIYIYIQYIMLL